MSDSYFASVPAVEELRKRNLLFIGVIKTATRQYLMAYFNMSNFQGKETASTSSVLTKRLKKLT
jgi:hypothetical protein